MRRRRFIQLVLALPSALALAPACTCAAPQPKDPLWHRETCAHCRMTVSDPSCAAQLVGPGQERRYYDDLGCALKDLAETPQLAAGRLYVRPRGGDAWVLADAARYADGATTPMSYGFAAAPDGSMTLAQVREQVLARSERSMR